MYRHWHRFSFCLPLFGFWFRGPGFFPRRDEYIRMLENYQRELKAELEELKETG
jgi:hypothetical protein